MTVITKGIDSVQDVQVSCVRSKIDISWYKGIRRIVPLIGFALTYAFLNRTMTQPLHTIPIASRGAHGPLTTKILFPLVFNLAQLGLFITMLSATPLLLIPVVGRRAFIAVIDYTKDGYGRLCK